MNKKQKQEQFGAEQGGVWSVKGGVLSEATLDKCCPDCYVKNSTLNLPHSTLKRAAFTLAEVLITLGIIGVVAALTLPTLIQNYRNHVVETRLKKFYTTFNQALLRSVADNGEMETWDWVSGKDNWDANLEKYVLPYMKIVESKYLDGSSHKFYYLPDGSAFTTSTNFVYYPSNPEKCPNSTSSNGVCRFLFMFRNTPQTGSNEHISRKGLDPYKASWDGTENGLYIHHPGGSDGYGCTPNERGYFCTALIQYNGWKIPKDYPRKIRF